METIYDLYAGDATGLQEVTGRFLQQLTLLKNEAGNWYRNQKWELLHRHTHQLQSTAALYEVPDLCQLLQQVSGLSRSPDGSANALATLIQELPQAIDIATATVANKLTHVS